MEGKKINGQEVKVGNKRRNNFMMAGGKDTGWIGKTGSTKRNDTRSDTGSETGSMKRNDNEKEDGDKIKK